MLAQACKGEGGGACGRIQMQAAGACCCLGPQMREQGVEDRWGRKGVRWKGVRMGGGGRGLVQAVGGEKHGRREERQAGQV